MDNDKSIISLRALKIVRVILFVCLLPMLFLKVVDLDEDKRFSLETKSLELYETGDFSQATIYAKKALDVAVENYGDNHTFTGRSFNVLATCYAAQKKYDKAILLFEKSLAVYEAQTPLKELDVAVASHLLAHVWNLQGEYGRAIPFLERALAIRERLLSSEHKLVVRTRNELADAKQHIDSSEVSLVVGANFYNTTDAIKALGYSVLKNASAVSCPQGQDTYDIYINDTERLLLYVEEDSGAIVKIHKIIEHNPKAKLKGERQEEWQDVKTYALPLR